MRSQQHIDAEWIMNQLSSARWHLDRAATAAADAAGRDVHAAREICEKVRQVLPDLRLSSEEVQRIGADLSDIRARLHAMKRGAGD